MKYIIPFLLIAILFSCSEEKKEIKEEHKDPSKIELAYHLQQGQVFYVTLDWSETVERKDSLGRGNTDTIIMQSVFKYRVDEVHEDGSVNMTLSYDRMKFGTFDSKDTSTFNTQDAMMFKAMANYVLKAKMDKSGYVYELTGADEFYTMGQPDTIVKDNEVMMTDMNQFFHVIPSTAVKVGDTWSMNTKVNFGYAANFASTYTLKSVINDMATIEVVSEISENPEGTTVFPGGFVLKQKLKGKHSSTIQFDLKKGLPVNTISNYQYAGEAKGSMMGRGFKLNTVINLNKVMVVTE